MPTFISPPSAEWMASYARRRLGIAGLLQAMPQSYFHCYMLLYCNWREGCHLPHGSNTVLGTPVSSHHHPSAA
jgi:hypothetical protein